MNTELQSKSEQSAVNSQGKTRKQKVRKDPNAPLFVKNLSCQMDITNSFYIHAVHLVRVK